MEEYYQNDPTEQNLVDTQKETDKKCPACGGRLFKRTGKSERTGKQYTYYACEKGKERPWRGVGYESKELVGFMTWDVPVKDNCPVCGKTMFKKAGRGAKKPFCINGVEIIPIRGRHYKLPVLGFRFGNIAYCTDMNHIPEEEFNKLEGLDHFVINCVKYGRHISHFSIEEAIEVAKRVGARQTWLTHLSHQLPPHEVLSAELPPHIQPAYDGLVLQ